MSLLFLKSAFRGEVFPAILVLIIRVSFTYNRLLAERNMNLTAASIFCFYLLWRVYELSMENVRYGEVALAQQGIDVSHTAVTGFLVVCLSVLAC